jgi:hypothetical protein
MKTKNPVVPKLGIMKGHMFMCNPKYLCGVGCHIMGKFVINLLWGCRLLGDTYLDCTDYDALFLLHVQDLKDYMRQAGEVTYADAHKQRRNEGYVYSNYSSFWCFYYYFTNYISFSLFQGC